MEIRGGGACLSLPEQSLLCWAIVPILVVYIHPYNENTCHYVSKNNHWYIMLSEVSNTKESYSR